MKKIEAIIRPEKLEDIKDALVTANFKGVSIFQIMGCGSQKGWKEVYRGTQVDLTILPKVLIEIIIHDDELEETLDIIIKNARTGEIGDGKIFVSEISDVIRIRTGERGSMAL